MCVDYESQLARRVAGDVWSGLSRAALAAGFTKTTAVWESLREGRPERSGSPSIEVFALGQDRPDAVDAVRVSDGADGVLYGVVVAVPTQTNPLSGSLLYQGVGRLTDAGVKAGMVEPALLHASSVECERYASRLLERLGSV
jgi:hypothetical protein